jgi:hypothetical protein
MRDIRENRGRCEAAIERESIQERFERGPGLARGDDHIGLPGGICPKIGGADPGEDLARSRIEHHRSGLSCAAIPHVGDDTPHFDLKIAL